MPATAGRRQVALDALVGRRGGVELNSVSLPQAGAATTVADSKPCKRGAHCTKLTQAGAAVLRQATAVAAAQKGMRASGCGCNRKEHWAHKKMVG